MSRNVQEGQTTLIGNLMICGLFGAWILWWLAVAIDFRGLLTRWSEKVAEGYSRKILWRRPVPYWQNLDHTRPLLRVVALTLAAGAAFGCWLLLSVPSPAR